MTRRLVLCDLSNGKKQLKTIRHRALSDGDVRKTVVLSKNEDTVEITVKVNGGCSVNEMTHVCELVGGHFGLVSQIELCFGSYKAGKRPREHLRHALLLFVVLVINM